jgi:3-deoxy-D-arabino-heptulosonate 7-phosphate (DAHP) synthase
MNEKKPKRKKLIIIAGPCAAESEEQMEIAIIEAKKRNVDFLRVNLWKPRTRPGFEGLGEQGIPLLIKAAQAGVNPGLEVITPAQAELVVNAVLPHLKKDGKLLLWIGARNQNHFIQREIARIVARDKRVHLMVKNQPWVSDEHWEGIVEHVLEGGVAREQLIICHRGFTPTGENPNGYRNIPDHAASKKIKDKTKIPMIFDPSHTGGVVENVFKIGKEAAAYNYDGIIVEVHHNPKEARTDSKQQLTWKEFDKLLTVMSMK